MQFNMPAQDEYYPYRCTVSAKADSMDCGLAGLVSGSTYVYKKMLYENVKAKVWILVVDIPPSTASETYNYPPGFPTEFTVINGYKYLIYDTYLTYNKRLPLFVLSSGDKPDNPDIPWRESFYNHFTANFGVAKVIIDENSIDRFKYKGGDDFS